MDELMSSVGIQIQISISEAIKEQVLPWIQASLRANSGKLTPKGWDIPSERLERRSEESYSQKVRSCSRSELPETDFVTKFVNRNSVVFKTCVGRFHEKLLFPNLRLIPTKKTFSSDITSKVRI